MKNSWRCLVCNAKNSKLLFYTKDRMFDIPGIFEVRQCNGCGLVMIYPSPKRQILTKHYPKYNYYSYSKGRRGIFASLRDFLIKHYYKKNLFTELITIFVGGVPALPKLKKIGRILDVGCGAGDTLLQLKGIGWDAYGLEIDGQAIKIAKKRGLDNVYLGGYENMNKFPDKFFDVIRLYHVIEHLDDPYRCLMIAKRKLKPGGELIIGTPNCESIVARFFGKYWYNLDIPRHLFLFSPSILQNLVLRVGLMTPSVQFCSAGGWLGSLQYYLFAKLKLKIQLIHLPLLVILFYPLEWLLDKLSLGDVFVLRTTLPK